MTSPSRIQNEQSAAMSVNGDKYDQFGSPGSRGPGSRGSNNHHPIAEFLYQLTKMLTDDNTEIIEWAQGRIKVHHPDRLEAEVLHKYFRHSKFASFQRQLNYFGFRKIAGKGKMSPCSYVNDAATDDLRSLLLIKRKTNGSAARKAMAARVAQARNGASGAHRDVQLTMPDPPSSAGPDLTRQSLAGAARPSDLQNAAALFQGALRTGLSQQQLQRKALSESLFFPSDNALAALAAGQTRQAIGLPQYAVPYGGIAGIHDQAATAAAMSLATSMARPATAAMNAAVAAGQNSNLFESSQLSSLVNEQSGPPAARPSPRSGDAPGRRVPSQSLLNRLPSSNTIFPDSLSTASLSHLLAPNRVSSLLSLSSFLSRDPSLVDLLGQHGPPQYPGVAASMDPPFQDVSAPPRPGNGKK